MRRTNWLVSGAVGLALVASLAACGSSTKRSSPNSTSNASATATGSAIKVGVICSCSGPFGPNEIPAGDVAQSWAKSVNASGGIDGHSIDLTFEDDASSPGTSVTDAQTLISDHVAAIIDISDFDSAWATAVSAAKIPVLGGQFSSQLFFTNPDFYPTGTTTDASFYSLASTAKLAGASNYGVLYCAEVAACQEYVAPLKAAGAQVGVPLTYNASIAATAPNYTAQCAAAQQGKVQAWDVASSEAIVARVASDCDRQGFDPTYLLEGTTYTPQLPAPGMKSLWIPFQIMPIFSSAPEVQAMNTAVDTYYPGLRSGKGGIWSQYAAQAWTAGLLLRDGVKDSGVGPSGTVTAATVTQGLDSIKNDTLDGWTPPLTFTAGQGHKVDCWFIAKWANGSPTLLDGGKATCLPGSAA